MDKQALAYRIRAFRKLKGYTQTELAELLGVSIAIVGTIERGTRRPDVKMLKRIAEALGIEPNELVPSEARVKGES